MKRYHPFSHDHIGLLDEMVLWSRDTPIYLRAVILGFVSLIVMVVAVMVIFVAFLAAVLLMTGYGMVKHGG